MATWTDIALVLVGWWVVCGLYAALDSLAIALAARMWKYDGVRLRVGP